MAQHRGVVVAKQGMVAASQPLAVSAGLNALMRGGTFVDAALAVSAALAVVEPSASQLGGDAFVIVYDAKTGQTTALNGSGAAPQKATLEHFTDGIPLRGLPAASVPGLVDTWFALHQKWGKLPVAELLAPAIGYAENGFPLSYRMARICRDYAPTLRPFPDSARVWLPDNMPPVAGQTIHQPELAWALNQIAQGGRNAFYNGEITRRVLEYSDANGGLFSQEDFANHQTQITEPIKTTYRGYTIHGQPPVSQGHILLQELNLVEGFDLAGMGHNSADAIHVQVEAKKLAFADRAQYLGDPNFVRVPIETLLSKPYADQRRGEINMQHAAHRARAGSIHHDTTYFCIADAEGNAISFIQSVFYVWGSGVIVPGTGILFNNRMTGFSLDPTDVNVLSPGKRTAHTLNAYIVTSPSSLAFIGGTPGADVQVQSNLQVICNIIDYGMNPQEAIEAARWQHGEVVTSGEGETGAGREVLAIESRIETGVRAELEARGHAVDWLPEWGHSSSYQLIARDPQTGAYHGGSDPRCDGHLLLQSNHSIPGW